MSLNSVLQLLATRIATEIKTVRTEIAAATPAGVILPYGGSAAPSGYLLCDGSAVSRTTYARLFGVIGSTFGGGDGSTTFNVPDTRARALVGVGTGKALASNDGLTEASRNARWSHAHAHTATTTNVAASAGTPSGTVVAASAGTPSGTVVAASAGTPSGTVVSASAGTPSGTNSGLNSALAPYFDLSIDPHTSHTHTVAGQSNATSNTYASGSTVNKNSPALGDYNGHNHGGVTGAESVSGARTHSFGITSTTHTHTFTGDPLAAHGHTFTGSALTAHGHTFTGDALGTHGHTFTGTAMATHNHTASTTVASGDPGDHPYLAVNHIIKT